MNEVDIYRERRERIQRFFGRRLASAARWSSAKAKTLARAGAKEAAAQLRAAAKDFKAGREEQGKRRLENARAAAKEDGQTKAAVAIEKQVDELE
jgi:hypothetical protein